MSTIWFGGNAGFMRGDFSWGAARVVEVTDGNLRPSPVVSVSGHRQASQLSIWGLM